MKRKWLENLVLYTSGFILLVIVNVAIFSLAFPVMAAPLFPECPQVAVAGGIKVYYCDEDIVEDPFYINQLGWMMPKPW